jgi:hypothetical protein
VTYRSSTVKSAAPDPAASTVAVTMSKLEMGTAMVVSTRFADGEMFNVVNATPLMERDTDVLLRVEIVPNNAVTETEVASAGGHHGAETLPIIGVSEWVKATS